MEKCGADDYFEKGIETAIPDGMTVKPVDISDLLCIEVDFREDLKLVNQKLAK